MNRRSFIRNIAIGAIVTPYMANVIKPEYPKHQFSAYGSKEGENWVTLLDSGQLRFWGVRGERFCASLIDRNGLFPHEKDFDKDPHHNEPFIRKLHVVECLPKFSGNDVGSVIDVVYSMTDLRWGQRRNLAMLLGELKEKMAYVCHVYYVRDYFHAKPKEDTWVPYAGGMTKERYKKHLEYLNESRI